MFDCKETKCKKMLADAPVVFEFLSKKNRAHFEKVSEYLEIAGVPFELDKQLVRGLDYYTRTAWEIKSAKLGSQDSISGGGRYDILVEQLGGKPTPGIGFAAGMERIILAMPDKSKAEPEADFGFYITVRSDEFKSEAFELLMNLRNLGIRAEKDYFDRSLKAQMKQANKSGMQYVIIMAEDEMARGAVVIRNLVNSEQVEIKIDDIYKMKSIEQFREVLNKSE
jgi:histidyl-tRNA synthetase